MIKPFSATTENGSELARADTVDANIKWIEMAGDQSCSEMETIPRMDTVNSNTNRNDLPNMQMNNTRGTSPLRQSKTEEESEEAMLKRLSKISINDMLAEVRSLWFYLD